MVKSFDLINNFETFKDLFDSAHDLIHIADLSGQLLYVNKSWQRVLEYEESEVQGISLYDIISDEDHESFAKYRRAVIAGQKPEGEAQFSVKTKSGRIVHLSGFIDYKESNGVALYTRGIFRDVTLKYRNEAQLKLLNEQLIEREANLKQLLDHAPDAVVVIDQNSLISYWNPKAERLFGWKSEEVTGKPLTYTIVPPQHREGHAKGMARFLSTGESHVINRPIEITALDRSGREFYISLTISTTRQNGKLAFIAFLRDIDKEKKNQNELDKRSEQLRLANEELQHFAHVVSHDMKEPTRKINIFVDRVVKDASNSLSRNSREYLDKVVKSASRLSKMIDDVLTYSFQHTGKHGFEVVDLNEITQKVVTDLELLIEEKNAAIRIADLPSIHAVPVMITQLFYNLLANSLKFSTAAVPPEIDVDYREIEPQSSEDAGVFEFTVRDNGIGFEQKDAAKIFDRFSRLHSKSEFEGTGLGLALCKKIVEFHSGRIWAESSGHGAIFKFVIPKSDRTA